MTDSNPLILPLWEGSPPNCQPAGQPEERVREGNNLWVRHVQTPAVEVRLPARGNATGQADAADPVERFSSRPDFMILVYPVITMMDATHGGSRLNLLGEHPSEDLVRRYSNELQATTETPPAFLVHAADDEAVPVRNSLLFHAALLAHHVPAELHVYPQGGHGFSLALGKGRLQDWTQLCARWLAEL